MAGESASNPRVTSSLDYAYLRAAVRASFNGVLRREPTASEWDYFVDKTSKPEQFSDGVWRMGWNRYWETRVDPAVSSASPSYGDQPAVFQPQEEHADTPHSDIAPQVTDPDGFREDVLTLLYSINDQLGELLQATYGQKNEVVKTLKDAVAVIPKLKLF